MPPKNLPTTKFWHIRLYAERKTLEETDSNGVPYSPTKPPVYDIELVTADNILYLLSHHKAIAEAYYQKECTPDGMIHWQLTLVLEKDMNPFQVRSLFKMTKGEYCYPCENLQASITYCQKDATRVEGPFSYVKPIQANALGKLIKFI